MNLQDRMNALYRDNPLEAIPWNLEQPPRILTELVSTERVKPCEAVDLGCGAGNYVIWLATLGFTMTGLDFSDAALDLAQQLAESKGIECHFEVYDMTGPEERFEGAFDFAFDWEVLHHVFPEQRAAYLDNVHRMLRPGGTYLSVCFSEADPAFEGTGKYRDTPMGTTLYFSSEEELRELFDPLFEIEVMDSVEVEGKREPHMAMMALMTRRNT